LVRIFWNQKKENLERMLPLLHHHPITETIEETEEVIEQLHLVGDVTHQKSHTILRLQPVCNGLAASHLVATGDSGSYLL